MTHTIETLGYSLSFNTGEDGTVMMESSDSEGGGSCWNYLPAKPENLFREGRILQTAKGTKIQTGTVLAEDGTGRGVAWRVTHIVTDADLDAMRVGFPGEQKAEPYLRPLTPAQRYTAMEEAKLRVAYSTGWNYSGAICQAALDIKKGLTPCLTRWREEMAKRSA